MSSTCIILFCKAAIDGDIRRMKSSLRDGADLSSKYEDWPPLHWAIFGDQHFAAGFLKRRGMYKDDVPMHTKLAANETR